MELKGYQQLNLNALDRFLTCVEKRHDIAAGFWEFWQTAEHPIEPKIGGVIGPYKDNVKGAPHVCLKVPTGGGKTFIASAAIKVAMDHFNPLYKVVVWLVPSNAILDQTLRNLRNKQHPYRERIDTDFQNRVEVFDKQQALMGQGFSLTTVRENLCVLVMSYDSFRTSNKDGRKVYDENENLQSFSSLVAGLNDGSDEVQLMRVIQAVHPVVIVDESHNATSVLSEKMLNEMQPSLVLDLTATPRENSNIISFTDALELKRNNMVKLPVIVYNHSNKAQVIDSALHLQHSLELTAKQDPSGNYIRPIVLFQAESKQQGKEDRDTFEKIKAILETKVPKDQIKIKTADIDELKGIDLMDKNCPVRYIITVNALKEGWDCPFAYILASLADRSSSVDVEQIVGRVLRLPYTRRNQNDVLNLSYVLTASAKFQETLNNVVKGLNNAGFSDRDYRAVDAAEPEKPKEPEVVDPTSLFPTVQPQAPVAGGDEIDVSQITFKTGEQPSLPADTLQMAGSAASEQKSATVPGSVASILENAQQQANEMNKQLENPDNFMVPVELAPAVKTAVIQSNFLESAKAVKLPMFYKPNQLENDIFGSAADTKLEGQHLLSTFKLSHQPIDITFAAAETTMYKVDIDENTDEHAPRFEKVKGAVYDYILNYIREAGKLEDKIKRCAHIVAGQMGKMSPLSQKEIQAYVARIFEDFDEAKLEDFMRHLYEYTDKIKKKILELEDTHKEREFYHLLETEQIILKPTYTIPVKITLKSPSQGIRNMLHSREESINGYEAEVINDVANLDNVEWWTRNVERNGFCINGFINHYPDFIVKTKKGKIVLVETKGDHLDAAKKINLGNMWALKAGSEYRYCLVYDQREVPGAYTKDKFIEMMRNL